MNLFKKGNVVNTKNVTVIYHDGCMDGLCSAWLLWKQFGSEGTTFIPMEHGDRAKYVGEDESWVEENIKDKYVYVADFSFDESTLKKWWKIAAGVNVYDHHVTAAKDLEGIIGLSRYVDDSGVERVMNVRFDMTECGASLLQREGLVERKGEVTKVAWKIVDYVKDRDLWKWELVKSREISAWLSSFIDFDKESQEELFKKINVCAHALQEDRQFYDLAFQGEAILRYQQQMVKKLCKNVKYIDVLVGDIVYPEIPVVNSSCLQSEIGETLSRNHPFAMIWYEKMGNNEKDVVRIYSLRSNREYNQWVDVSVVAKAFGGGGHSNAAGFEKKESFVHE